jgi:site-specific DNA recombinase
MTKHKKHSRRHPLRPNASSNLAVEYDRVSSKEQEREGFSISAQQRLIRKYAEDNALKIVQSYVDVETAKSPGRSEFQNMVVYLRAHPSVRHLLTEKTDRLLRNFKDFVILDDLDIALHLVKDNQIISRESRSTEKFIHGIKVLMAKNYIDNLREEAMKGMQEKAEQGGWPSKAPLGYKNVVGPDGKKIIIVDTDVAPIIKMMFERYSTGEYSIDDITDWAAGEGLAYKKSRAKVPTSAVHTMLRHILYAGQIEWNGKVYAGTHTALVPLGLWQTVQDILENRGTNRCRRTTHDFAFSGLISCSHCGCAAVAEIHKAKYVYYHLTAYPEKCQRNHGLCRQRYVREEVLDQQFSELLSRIQFPDEVLDWARAVIQASYTEQRRVNDQAIARLRAEHKRLNERIEAMYVDKLEGKIEADFFKQMHDRWRSEQSRLLADIEHHEVANASYIEQGIKILELAQNARPLYELQPPGEKRRLLNFILSNCLWDDGDLTPNLRQPFDLIMQTAESGGIPITGTGISPGDSDIWLGDLDSNQGCPGQSREFYR